MPATVEALEELYRSRYASYRGGVAALTGYDEAWDVVQESFAQALRDRKDYRGEGSLAAWVWRIAFRTAMSDGTNVPITRSPAGRETRRRVGLRSYAGRCGRCARRRHL